RVGLLHWFKIVIGWQGVRGTALRVPILVVGHPDVLPPRARCSTWNIVAWGCVILERPPADSADSGQLFDVAPSFHVEPPPLRFNWRSTAGASPEPRRAAASRRAGPAAP